jgi:integrase
MALYKRAGIWYIDLTAPSGQRIRTSTQTTDKKAAREYHDRVKAESWRIDKLGEKADHSWEEAAVRFLKESAGKASLKEYVRQIAFWTDHFKNSSLSSISRERVAKIVEGHANTPATRNRYIACLRALLRKAEFEWSWIERAPRLMTYAEPKHRIRWLKEAEAEKLLAALPLWLREMAIFALATGLRQSNVLRLEWSQLDLERELGWIHADQAKGRRTISFPLGGAAKQVLLQRLGKHPRRVFLGPDGLPMDSWPSAAQQAWKKACRASGIGDFRWHDLRHTWASWHVQKGTPLLALKELGGWETLEMVKKYAHLSTDHLKTYAGNLELDQITARLRHKPEVQEQGALYLTH